MEELLEALEISCDETRTNAARLAASAEVDDLHSRMVSLDQAIFQVERFAHEHLIGPSGVVGSRHLVVRTDDGPIAVMFEVRGAVCWIQNFRHYNTLARTAEVR